MSCKQVASMAIGVAAFLATSAMAEEVSLKGAQSYEPVVSSESIPLPNGNTLLRVTTRDIQWVQDEDERFHAMSQDCDSVLVMSPEGEQLHGAGTCDLIDDDGDGYGISWEQEAGAERSTFNVTWGFGKFTGMEGRGSFATTSDGRFPGEWEGTFTLR